MLPPLSSNRKTETATTVSLVVEDLSKKLTHHFTTLHHCLNFLTQEYDTNWSGWFQGNGYFQHWITFIYRAPMAAIDSRKRQNGESVHQDDWMISFWDTISQHVQNHNGQQHSTACTVQRRIFLHQKVNDCLNIKERNPWQANDAHNSKTLKVCKFRLSTLKKNLLLISSLTDTPITSILCDSNLQQMVCRQFTVKIMQNLTISTLFLPMCTTKILPSCTASSSFWSWFCNYSFTCR